MTKILLRNLPNNYTSNNVFGLFSFYTPETMTSILTNLEIQDKYTFTRPVPSLPVVSVNSWDGLMKVFGDPKTFRTTYDKAVKDLTNGYGYVNRTSTDPY
jgi:linoleate 10R-lipoxygenase